MTRPLENAPIFVDCDPGIDDALALLTIFGTPGIRLLGISTVGGNVSLDLTEKNALRLASLARRGEVPVSGGMAHPMRRRLTPAEHVHGADGLGEIGLGEPDLLPAPKNGVELMIEAVTGVDQAVILATGPLTNVATALNRSDRLRGHIRRVVWMGGAFGQGNVTPAAEYNAWVDPDAARIVMKAGIPFTMVGLNVTHQVTIDRATLDAYREVGNPVAETTARMLDFYVRFHERVHGTDRSPIHDVVAAVEAMWPGTIRTERRHVDVETRGDVALGATVVDARGVPGEASNVDVGIEADATFVLDAIVEALSRYGRKSPVA